jgi:hypothetical protein
MDLQDRTILYYTANTEDLAFEEKIIDDLKKKAGSIPIISISRKPIDLGINICVGEQVVSYTNEWKQLLLGLKMAKTKYCIAAEADCLYPPEYFTFTPPSEDIMCNYKNIWMIWKHHNGIWKKTGYCEGAQMCGREFWIKRLEPLLPSDWTPYTREEENELVIKIFSERKEWTGSPIISFKTRNGMSDKTTFRMSSKTKELPYWGKLEKIKEVFI